MIRLSGVISSLCRCSFLVEVNPSYVNPKMRWKTYILFLHEQIVGFMRATGKEPAEQAVLRVISDILQAIDGQIHNVDNLRKWLEHHPPPKPPSW